MVSTTTKGQLKARFDALLAAIGAGEQERAALRADFAALLGEVDGLGTFTIEIDDWSMPDLPGWDWPDLTNWDFGDLAQVQEQGAAQLEALASPTSCPYCGQPMPSK